MTIKTTKKIMGVLFNNIDIDIYKTEISKDKEVLIVHYSKNTDGEKLGDYEDFRIPAYIKQSVTKEDGSVTNEMVKNPDYAIFEEFLTKAEQMLVKYVFPA